MVLPSLVYTFLHPFFLAAAVWEVTESTNGYGSLWYKYQIFHVPSIRYSIRYSMFWVGKQVMRRILLLAIIKGTAESNPCTYLTNILVNNEHTFFSEMKLYCVASLSRANKTHEKGEEKNKWISFSIYMWWTLFSLYTDLWWRLGRGIFLSFKELVFKIGSLYWNPEFMHTAAGETTCMHKSFWKYLVKFDEGGTLSKIKRMENVLFPSLKKISDCKLLHASQCLEWKKQQDQRCVFLVLI